MAQMTKEALVEACKKNGGYANPRLNDQLYLQYKGYTKIENLEPYTDLKVLWLEQNGIETIEGLDTLEKLCSLFLQNNIVRKIGKGLSSLHNLRILNLSHNMITRLDGLSCCPLLETLTVSHCKIESLECMEEVFQLPELSCFDVSFNQITSFTGNATDDTLVSVAGGNRDTFPQGADSPIIKFFQRIPAVSVLYLHGNEVIRGLKDYRRNMVAHLPNLSYLDERPVFPDERRATMAWLRGGSNAESAEREAIREEKRKELSTCVNDMIQLRERTKDQREANEKQWREVQAAREKWEQDQRIEEVRWTTELDHEEFEVRSTVEGEEMREWGPLASQLVVEYAALEKRCRQEREEAAAKAQAEKELAEQEAAFAAAAKAERLSKEQERQLWLKRFAEEEDLYVDGMQDDLNNFLDQLTPATSKPQTTVSPSNAASTRAPPQKPQMLTLPTPSTTSNSLAESHRKQMESQRSRAAGAATPPSADQAQAKKQTVAAVKKKKTAVWEQYYAYEKAAKQKYEGTA